MTAALGPQKPWMTWTGRILSAIPALVLLMSGVMAFMHPPQIVAEMKRFGYPENTLPVVAALETLSAVLYAIPRTAVLGALLMTAYLGGAVATHVRIHDPGYPMAVIMGIIVWAGLFLRDPRIRELLPLRR